MDHVVYMDTGEGELKKLLNGSKRMIIRGANGRKLPYGRVQAGDRLFFIQNDGKCEVRASAKVTMVINSDKLSEEEARQLLDVNQEKLLLSQAQIKRWVGKRYLVLIGIEEASLLPAFVIDRSEYGNMDDWLPVGDISRVKKSFQDPNHP